MVNGGHYITVPSTRSSPHEIREANAMRTRRNIPIFHFILDNKGKAMKVPSFPNALTGNLYYIEAHDLVNVCTINDTT